MCSLSISMIVFAFSFISIIVFAFSFLSRLVQGFLGATSGRLGEAPGLRWAEFLSKFFEFFREKYSICHALCNKNKTKKNWTIF